MRGRIGIAAILPAVLLAACEMAEVQKCGYLAAGYPLSDAQEIKDLPDAGTRRVPLARFAQVQSCWAVQPFGGDNQHTLEYVETRWVSGEEYYLLFEPAGITDVQVFFHIKEPVGVVGAGKIGLL